MQELAGLSSEARELALTRFRLLQPHLEAGCELRSVAAEAEAEASFRTLQRWMAQYRRSGLVALARKARGDQGGRLCRLPRSTVRCASSRGPRARPPRATGSFATLWASCLRVFSRLRIRRQGVQ